MLHFSVFRLCIDIDAIMGMYIIVDLAVYLKLCMMNYVFGCMYIPDSKYRNFTRISHETRTVVGFHDICTMKTLLTMHFYCFIFLIMVKRF